MSSPHYPETGRIPRLSLGRANVGADDRWRDDERKGPALHGAARDDRATGPREAAPGRARETARSSRRAPLRRAGKPATPPLGRGDDRVLGDKRALVRGELRQTPRTPLWLRRHRDRLTVDANRRNAAASPGSPPE